MMKKLPYWLVCGALAVSGAALGRAASGPVAPKTPDATPESSQAARFDPAAVDRAVGPCVDFYQFACGPWMKNNPIPADQSAWSRGSELSLRNQQVLRDILEKAQRPDPGRGPIDQKIGDAYAACMDQDGIEKKGLQTLKPVLDRIAALRDKAGLPQLMAELHRRSASEIGDSGMHAPLFGFTAAQDFDDATRVVAVAEQGGLGLPDRDYYLKEDPRSRELLKGYEAHLVAMFGLLGEPKERAAASARTVLDIETALARSSMDIVKRRDAANLNHKLSLAQLQALTPSFQWERYLKDLGAPPSSPHYLVTVPEFFQGVESLLKSRPVDDVRTYLRWHAAHEAAPLLSDAFVQENFRFYGKTLRGAQELRPRWKRCVGMVDGTLGEALGRAYVERTFGAEGKERMQRLVGALSQAMQVDIQGLPWMSPATRKEAQAKLAAIENKIGYPARWRDYSSVTISRGDALGNAERAAAFEVRRQLNKIGKPVDRAEWLMTPATVNAYYDPQMNTINFPAGILQPPYFDKSMDDAVNLGAIGSVIGHELTHGFDDSGRKFDARGNLRDWWTATDSKEFEQRAQCIADQYGEYVATDDVKLNGKLTLGENTADAGGVRVALLALRQLAKEKAQQKGPDGFTAEQRFFVSYAQAWCSNLTPKTLRMLALSNPHSPPRYRVNGVVANLPDFAKAFSCQPGQPMVRKNACRVW